MPQTNWGRKETIIWPPRKPIYCLGALFLALITTGLFVYLQFTFGMTPIEKYYLPLYLKTEITNSFRNTGQYQLLYISDGKNMLRLATDQDVEAGSSVQRIGKPLTLKLSADAMKQGCLFVYRGPVMIYQNKALRSDLRQVVYENDSLVSRFELPLTFGLAALLIQLPFSISKDIRRYKEMKYGRRLKGPVMVTPRQFNRAVRGTGIGIKTDDFKEPLGIPRAAEDQHIEIIGDTGTGKTTLIMQLLRQIQARGHSAIVYDPACEFIQRFYDENRDDIVLNPLDKRCPYWGPSEELVRWAEAKTIAVSLFQPTTDRKGEFFIESPQKIFAHLLMDLPTPSQLVAWMSNPEEIDKRVRNTELASLIDPKAPQQRAGALASLGLIAGSFRLLPKVRYNGTLDSARVVGRTKRLDLHHLTTGRTRGAAPSTQPMDRHAGFAAPDCAKRRPETCLVCPGRAGLPTEAATASHCDYRKPEIQEPNHPGLSGKGSA